MEARIKGEVNNVIYDHYGERWYTAKDDPIALLRAEGRARTPWLVNEIRKVFAGRPVNVLDVGCGAGFLTNELAREGFAVTGIDASVQSLEVARHYDATGSVRYETGDANNLPYPAETFEVACAMDLLEHVEQPARVVGEISRVLKPGGLFFFHTFNRNLISRLVVIRGVELFVKNTPRDMHILRFFIKPAELRRMCEQSGLKVESIRGLAPKVFRPAFWKMILTGEVGDDFEFQFTGSTLTGYVGMAIKSGKVI